MWLWEETSRESLTISCIQESFNASKDIQGWVDTVNLNLLTQNQYLFYLLIHRFDTTAKTNKQTNITKTKKNKKNRINFIWQHYCWFWNLQKNRLNLFCTEKVVSKLHIPCWILLKETVQVIFNQNLEQDFAVAGLVVKKQNKRVQENV